MYTEYSLMFQTSVGAQTDSSSVAYLRLEKAQVQYICMRKYTRIRSMQYKYYIHMK